MRVSRKAAFQATAAAQPAFVPMALESNIGGSRRQALTGRYVMPSGANGRRGIFRRTQASYDVCRARLGRYGNKWR